MNNIGSNGSITKVGVISLLFGVLSIVLSLAGVWFIGIISTGTALVFAVIGFIISIRCRKATSGRHGTAGFCSSLIGIVIAGSLSLVCIMISLSSGGSALLGLSGTDFEIDDIKEEIDQYGGNPEEYALKSEILTDCQCFEYILDSVKEAISDEKVKKEIGVGYELVLPAKKGATWNVPDKPCLIEVLDRNIGENWRKYKVKRSEYFWDQDGNSVKEWKIIVYPDGNIEAIAPYK